MEPIKYSADWIRALVKEKDAHWLTNHDCSLCGVDVGYMIDGDNVAYRSGCGCSWSPDRPTSYEDIAKWLAMQSSDEIRDRIMEKMS